MSNDRAVIESAIAESERQPFGAGKEDGEQQSIGWLYERTGFATCSRFKDVMDFTKAGKPGAKRTAYHWELVIERLTGKPVTHWTSAAMEHGTAMEPLARMAYEARTGAIVTQTGFRKHKTLEWVGGSPDGVIEPSGGFEAKCPFNSQHHLQCFLTGMPEEHMAQVQGLIWLHGADWWDFTSYDQRMPEGLDLFVQRIERDDAYIATLGAQIVIFLAEVAATVAGLQAQREAV